jgi:hypothetical protein
LMSSTPARFLTHSPATKLRPAWHGMLYGAGGLRTYIPTQLSAYHRARGLSFFLFQTSSILL